MHAKDVRQIYLLFEEESRTSFMVDVPGGNRQIPVASPPCIPFQGRMNIFEYPADFTGRTLWPGLGIITGRNPLFHFLCI